MVSESEVEFLSQRICASRIEETIWQRMAEHGYPRGCAVNVERPGGNDWWRPNLPDAFLLAQKIARQIDPSIGIQADGYRLRMTIGYMR